MLAYPSLQGVLQLDMYKSSDIPLYQSEPLPSVINPEPNATSRLPRSADHPPDGVSWTRAFVGHTCTASIGCIRDTARRGRRIATGIALGATKREGEKGGGSEEPPPRRRTPLRRRIGVRAAEDVAIAEIRRAFLLNGWRGFLLFLCLWTTLHS